MDKRDMQEYLLPGTYEQLAEQAREILDETDTPERIVDRLLPMIATALEEGRKTRQKAAQADGIMRAKTAGIHVGRRPAVLPKNFPEVMKLYLEKRISADAAASLCGIGMSTFYDRVRKAKADEKAADE